MKNSELARKFVKEGATNGTGSNMFIEGNAIYSYGHHFPMAVRLSNGRFLYNTDKYSVSTGKHQGYVLYEIPDNKHILATTSELQEAIRLGVDNIIEIERTVLPETFNEMQKQIKEFLKKQGFGRRASTRSKKFIEEMKKLAVLENL